MPKFQTYPLRPLIRQLVAEGKTQQEIAEALMAKGIRTIRGNKLTQSFISRLMKKLSIPIA